MSVGLDPAAFMRPANALSMVPLSYTRKNYLGAFLMAYDPSIILSGQAPNFLATIAAANEAASRKHEIDRQNAMSAMLQQNGAGIMGGDAAALNSLAAFDPSAALGIRRSSRIWRSALKDGHASEGSKAAGARPGRCNVGG